VSCQGLGALCGDGVGVEPDTGRRTGASIEEREGPDGGAEFAADVRGVQFAAVSSCEYRPGGPALAVAEVGECLGGEGGQAECAPGGGGFGVAVSADRPPDCDACGARGSRVRAAEVDVLPRQGAGFFGADAGTTRPGYVGADPGALAGAKERGACTRLAQALG